MRPFGAPGWNVVMPYRPASPCTYGHCPALVPGGGRCPKHRVQHNRGSSSQQGYGGAWRKVRQQVKDEEPFCRRCGAPTTDVDHIIPRRQGGSDARSNLQGLCHACHSRLTASFDGGFGHPIRGRGQIFEQSRLAASARPLRSRGREISEGGV